MVNQPIKFEIKFVEHKGYYITKSNVEGFDPNTYGWDKPVVDENGICWDETCQKSGYCRLNKEKCYVKDKI